MWSNTLVWEPFPLLVALALFLDATGAALVARWPALGRSRPAVPPTGLVLLSPRADEPRRGWLRRLARRLPAPAAPGTELGTQLWRWLHVVGRRWTALLRPPSARAATRSGPPPVAPARFRGHGSTPAAAAAPPPAWGHQVAGLLLALFVGWAVAVNWTQAQAAYSTNYYYGTRGQREVAAALDALGYSGPWVGAKEVAWYASNQYYIDADTFWWLVIAEGFRFEGHALGYDVPVLVPWTTDPHVRHFFWEQLHARYLPVAEVADYTIWVRADTPLKLAMADTPSPDTLPRSGDDRP
jgi:hypothetical protein